MEAVRPQKRRKRFNAGASKSFKLLQTKVPAEVHEHFHAAAKAHGLSLSRYMEELAKVDPLAPGSPPGSTETEAKAS